MSTRYHWMFPSSPAGCACVLDCGLECPHLVAGPHYQAGLLLPALAAPIGLYRTAGLVF